MIEPNVNDGMLMEGINNATFVASDLIVSGLGGTGSKEGDLAL